MLRGPKKSDLLDQEQREALLKHLVECGEKGGKEGRKGSGVTPSGPIGLRTKKRSVPKSSRRRIRITMPFRCLLGPTHLIRLSENLLL